MRRKRCPKCKRRRPGDQFSCEWCDECQADALDAIAQQVGRVVLFAHQDLNDDAEDAWGAAWKLAMSLPADFPDYAELCDALSDVHPVQEYVF